MAWCWSYLCTVALTSAASILCIHVRDVGCIYWTYHVYRETICWAFLCDLHSVCVNWEHESVLWCSPSLPLPITGLNDKLCRENVCKLGSIAIAATSDLPNKLCQYSAGIILHHQETHNRPMEFSKHASWAIMALEACICRQDQVIAACYLLAWWNWEWSGKRVLNL